MRRKKKASYTRPAQCMQAASGLRLVFGGGGGGGEVRMQ
jgi:hypothetical protein